MDTVTEPKPVQKTGRPKNIDWNGLATDPVKAVEKSIIQWRYTSLKLNHEVQSYLKKGESVPPALMVQAGIAYDKAFSKADSTDMQVTVPRSVELAIVRALNLTK